MQKTIVRIALLFLCLGTIHHVNAQMKNFIHYGGVGYQTPDEFSNVDMMAMYNPKYVISSFSEKTSLSLGTYLSYFGESESFNGIKSSNTRFFMPVVAEFNIGRHATFEANNRLGLFVGGGGGFFRATSSFQDAKFEYSTMGGIVTGGIRLKAFRQSMAIMGSYFVGKDDVNIITLGLLYGINRNEEIRAKGTSNASSGGGGGGGYRYRRSSPYRSKRWFQRANRRQRTRIPRGDRSWRRNQNKLRN